MIAPSKQDRLSGLFTEPQYRLSRAYKPTIGRFETMDNITLNAGDTLNSNLYAYVAGNPVNASDPSGHDLIGTLITMGIMVALDVLLFPNVLNAPGPRDRIQADRGGDMAGGAVLTVALTPGFAYIGRFVVSPLLKYGLSSIRQALGTAAARAATAEAATETVQLYRVVSEEEWQHIQKTGQLLPEPNGRSYETGKWFWRTTQAAEKWIAKTGGFYPNGCRVIAAEVPAEAVSASQQVANLDQIGDGVFLTTDQLATTVAKDTGQ